MMPLQFVTTARRVLSRTFHSLNVLNYRLYFVGQAISSSGTWVQLVAEHWLVIRLGGGRVMALYSVAFLGMAPIGRPLVGWVAQAFGARSAFWLAAVACIAAGAVPVLAQARLRVASTTSEPQDVSELKLI